MNEYSLAKVQLIIIFVYSLGLRPNRVSVGGRHQVQPHPDVLNLSQPIGSYGFKGLHIIFF